ncbi:ABC transporter ATP-binding protein [Phreatobacter aquaticus]|uniref:ABC transporter ATP-binding protein n=1 Tax=Phreatobacter aquaticus TaxID=2570229 RepID=A0A4D7QFA9_9HYPH|nr:ABC transporter ATP-binding protein [Phreatobacter aquaticus]QCK85848.1 ABC transporter ATP-binding protein [Phreatobacter aquaticus]
MSAFSIEGLVGGYGAADHVVKGVDLQAAPGELVCIIGPNGAGKSTVLKLAAGLLSPKAGRVTVGETAIANASPQAVLAAGFVLVPQEKNVFGGLSVEENLAMGTHMRPALFKARRDAVFDRLPLLAARRRQLGKTLSGGQRQLLAMGIALMAEPKVLALDEPTAGLSPVAADGLFATIRGLASGDVAVVMVEQNALEALTIADRAYVLVDGRVAREGRASDIAADDDIRRLFLGGRKAA